MGHTLPLRMRMFAGRNGSGKTTVQREISRQFTSRFLGVLVNPDDLEATIGRNGRLDLALSMFAPLTAKSAKPLLLRHS